MKLFTVGKVGCFCDAISHALEKRREEPDPDEEAEPDEGPERPALEFDDTGKETAKTTSEPNIASNLAAETERVHRKLHSHQRDRKGAKKTRGRR